MTPKKTDVTPYDRKITTDKEHDIQTYGFWYNSNVSSYGISDKLSNILTSRNFLS